MELGRLIQLLQEYKDRQEATGKLERLINKLSYSNWVVDYPWRI